MPRRSGSIAPTAMPCWGWGDVAAARKEAAAAERYYQQALRLDRGNNLAVRGLANLYRAESPEKASAWIAGLPPAQRRSIDDIERSLTNDRLEKQAQALESQGNWAQAAEVQRRRLALDPDSVWITYRLARDLVSAGERQEADALMRTMVNRQPQDAERVYASGLTCWGTTRTIWLWRKSPLCRTARGRITFVNSKRAWK